MVRRAHQSDHKPEETDLFLEGSLGTGLIMMREFSHFIGTWCRSNVGHINKIKPAGYRLGLPQGNSLVLGFLGDLDLWRGDVEDLRGWSIQDSGPFINGSQIAFIGEQGDQGGDS